MALVAGTDIAESEKLIESTLTVALSDVTY
jgi:hypothetical protein